MYEIVEGVYFENAYRSGNVACTATDEGAVLIDTPMLPGDAWDWLKKIAPATKKGIACLINTDYQVERILGNCFFPAAVTIAHQSAWVEMQRYYEGFLQRYLSHYKEYQSSASADLSRIRIVLPEVTLTMDMTLYKGERIFRLIHAGGHTAANIMVHLAQEQILFTGDVVVTGEHPSLGQANSTRWLDALEMIRRMNNVDIIVPGRGDPCDRSAIEMLKDYIIKLRERVYEHYANGYTRRETVDKVRMQDFFGIPPAHGEEMERRIRGSVERVYDEFKKEAEKRKH